MKMKAEDKLFALQSLPLLEKLNKEEFEDLLLHTTARKFSKGDLIYKEKDKANQVYFVFNGKVKLASLADCGKTLIKDIIHKQDIFGENIFQESAMRTEYAEVLENTTVIFEIDKGIIMDLVVRNQKFSDALVQIIMTRMNNLEQRMKNFIFLKAKSRIGEFLGRMGAQRGIKIGIDEMLINHGLSHKDIAYMTDTSRQTVARVLGELKKENLIHFSARKPSKILIRDIAALRSI